MALVVGIEPTTTRCPNAAETAFNSRTLTVLGPIELYFDWIQFYRAELHQLGIIDLLIH